MSPAPLLFCKAGARSISAFATHGVFPDGALEKLRQTSLFENIICTDSHPRAAAMQNDFLRVVSIADILVAGLSAGF